MASEMIFMRDDGDDGLELTSISDKRGIAYIRADLTRGAVITERRDFYLEGDDFKDDLKRPCATCLHSDDKDEDDFPCFGCVHLG